jgi:hypothetical protein
MSEIIDLTNDEMPSVRAQPIQKKTRAPPKCGHCGIQGHTVRSCNDPEVMNKLRQLHQMVYRYPPYETVINWLHTLDVKVLQLILSKYTYTVYRKHSKEMCIDALSVVISDKYREEERRMMISLESVFRYGDLLIWIEGLQNVPQLYRQYCAQFMEDETTLPPTEEECQILVDSIQNHHISQNISYYIAKRFNEFIMYKYTEFRRGTARTTSNTIKYMLTRKPITIPIQIECPICMETKETPNIITTTCSHQFCKECITNLLHKTTRNRCNCPLCRNPIHKIIQETLQ